MTVEENRTLSVENEKKVADWLTAKCPNLACEVCGTRHWSIAKDIVVPVPLKGNSLMLGGGNSYPQVQIICSNCANTKYFNTVVIGIKVDGENHG